MIRGEKLSAKPHVLFENYILLVKKHKAKIIGWPLIVPFGNPSLITSIPLMHTLYDAWMSGSAHWVLLTTKQLATFLADVKSHLPDQPAKVRKQRSHKNKKQKWPDGNGESEDEDNGEEEWVTVTKMNKAKTKTTSAKPAGKKPCCNPKVARQLPRSKSVINTSDEEDNKGHWGIEMGTNP